MLFQRKSMISRQPWTEKQQSCSGRNQVSTRSTILSLCILHKEHVAMLDRRQASCILRGIHKRKCFAVALADKESLREGKLRSLRQALDLYRARLGLQFRKGAVSALCYCV